MALLLLVLALAPGTQAMAEEPAGPAVIAILPLSSADPRMGMYGKPVADAVAHEAQKNARRTELRIQVVDGDSAVPSQADLVVDGRIVAMASGRIVLEAQLRDPERGVRMAVVATEPGALTQIDELARALGTRLALELARVAAEARRLRRAPLVMPETVISISPQPGAGGAGASEPAGTREGRPGVLVFGAVGQAAGGLVPVEHVATHAGHELVSRLGYVPVAATERSMVPVDRAVSELGRTGSALGLMIHVERIDFFWYGVLAARGTVRVVVIDERGQAVYDRRHRTDTVIGSRGDRHAALVRFVMAQAGDMAMPELARVMAHRGGARAAGRASAP